MSKYTYILLIFIITAVLSACTSTVRFSHKVNNAQKKSTETRKNNTKIINTSRETQISELRFADNSSTNYNISSQRRSIIEEAQSWLGVPYRYAGNTRSGVDCSGFVVAVFSANGITLPRTSRDQFQFVSSIDIRNAEPGDLIFFQNRGRISHVGIYVGNDMMIHASTSLGVVIQNINDNYYSSRYAGTGRVSNL